MTSSRHQHAIARITHHAYGLSRREREGLGLPPKPVRRNVAAPPFPSDPAAFVWFALTTAKQAEGKAVQALSRGGMVAFNPTEMVLARSSRRLKFKRKERERAILTSVVLVGFKGRWVEREKGAVLHADVPWLTVLGTHYVTGVIGMGQGPVPVPLGNVLVLHDQTGRHAVTRNWSAAVGDAVKITFGAFQGQSGQVVELVDGEAKVALFGAGVLATLAQPLAVPEMWMTHAD